MEILVKMDMTAKVKEESGRLIAIYLRIGEDISKHFWDGLLAPYCKRGRHLVWIVRINESKRRSGKLLRCLGGITKSKRLFNAL